MKNTLLQRYFYLVLIIFLLLLMLLKLPFNACCVCGERTNLLETKYVYIHLSEKIMEQDTMCNKCYTKLSDPIEQRGD